MDMKLSSINNETIRLKIRNKIVLPLTKNIRRKKIYNPNFTIISNNCWGGTVYESYGIRKMSPTVGMFIMPEDYLKMIKKLKYYLEQPLVFINPDNSKWRKKLEHKSNWNTYLIGKIDDIELHMLHYHDENVAKSKWESRIERINWNRILYKFNDQNGATKEQILQFLNMPLKNKICFIVKKEFFIDKSIILIRQPGDKESGINASREPFGKSKYIDLNKLINELG